MKRRPARLFVLLLMLMVGGAIVNVAVAWGCACWSKLRSERILADQRSRPGQVRWNAYEECRGFAVVALRLCGFYERSPFDLESVPEWSLLVHDKSVRASMTLPINDASEIAAGWPMLAVCAAHPSEEVIKYGMRIARPSTKGGLREVKPKRALPLRPIWPGFAINTVVYAAVLWMPFAFPTVLRRRWRGGRGLCPKCAYDLRNRPTDSTVCPECGTVVVGKPRRGASTTAQGVALG